MTTKSPEQQLAGWLAKYTPEIRAVAEAVLAKMRRRLPTAVQLVYDNYNALVIGFGPTERASQAVFSVVLYPRWVTLFFLRGARLPDPDELLKGSGKIVRHLILEDAKVLDRPAVRALMAHALEAAEVPMPPGRKPGPMLIKAAAAKQRPRRPR